jgi:predicted Zn-dependent protease with MMP-like domain
LADIDVKALVEAALIELAEPFKGSLGNPAVLVDDFPDDQAKRRFSGNILGLYRACRTQSEAMSAKVFGPLP